MPSGEEGSKGRDADLEELPELPPTVASFLRGSLEMSDDEGREMLPEPAVLDFAGWVWWKAGKCDTPSWWMELSVVPGEDNTRELARQVRASFGTAMVVMGTRCRKGYSAGSPCSTMPSLANFFMLLPDSIFTSWDIREVPREKVVAYARALQYWAEQNDLPTGGEPHLLAKGVLELREEVK